MKPDLFCLSCRLYIPILFLKNINKAMVRTAINVPKGKYQSVAMDSIIPYQ